MKIDSEIIEAERVDALKKLGILDTPPHKNFDNITSLAATILNTPIALISLVDESRQWFKSAYGLDATETCRKISFCQYTIQQSSIFEVCDTHLDTMFVDNPLVTGDPNIRFYAGAPLTTKQGHRLGSLCVIDHHPRSLNEKERETLLLLAEQAVSMIELYEQKNTNSSLNQSLNEKIHILDEISNDMPAMVIYWDKNQVCRFVSRSYCRQIDKPMDQVIGHHYDSVVPEKLATTVKPCFLKALNGEFCETDASDAAYTNSDAVRHGQYIPDFDEDGQVQGVLVLITDITYQVKAEKNVALFSKVIGHSSDCILITDEHFEIEYVNKSFTTLTQYTLDEITGQTPDFLFFGHQNTSLEAIKKTLKKDDHWHGDLWHSNKIGAVFFALVSIDVIKDANDNITQYILSLRDQTENEKMRSDLFIMSDMLNRTGKMAKVGGWEYNLISKNLLWTEEVFRIHELQRTSEPNIEAAMDFYPAEAKQALARAMEIAAEAGTPWDLELPFITAQKNYRWVRATGECIQFNNKPLKLTGTFQDITDRKVAELQKEQDGIKHRNTLVKEVHHRIKNNLQGVSGILSNFAEQHPTQAALFNEANAQLQSVAVIYGLQSNRPDAFIEISELTSAIKNNIERLWQTNIGFDIDHQWIKAYASKNESVPLALIINELITNAVKHQIVENSAVVSLKHLPSTLTANTNIKNKILISVSNKGDYLAETNTNDILIQDKTQSGLALMSTLMPKRGAYIQWDIKDKMIQVSLELSYPVISFEKEDFTQRGTQYE